MKLLRDIVAKSDAVSVANEKLARKIDPVQHKRRTPVVLAALVLLNGINRFAVDT